MLWNWSLCTCSGTMFPGYVGRSSNSIAGTFHFSGKQLQPKPQPTTKHVGMSKKCRTYHVFPLKRNNFFILCGISWLFSRTCWTISTCYDTMIPMAGGLIHSVISRWPSPYFCWRTQLLLLINHAESLLLLLKVPYLLAKCTCWLLEGKSSQSSTSRFFWS